MRIIGYTYEADFHCVEHAVARFGREALDNATARDSEGNEVRPVFESDEWEDPQCAECLEEEISNRVQCDCGTVSEVHELTCALFDDLPLNAVRITCPQCNLLSINGVACHETGCPNSGAKYEDGEWVKCHDCFECGCPVRDGEACDCMEPVEDFEEEE